MQNLQTSTTLQGGKYIIERVLGQGGFCRVFMALMLLLFPVLVMAQASGGQIRRPVKKQSVVSTRSNVSTSQGVTIERTEQRTPASTPPSIQPISKSDLAIYNVVVCTYGILANAQGACQKLRDDGWGAQIYLDSKKMYRVLMVGTDQEPEALVYRNHAKQTYPDAWILKIENGQEVRL